MTDERKQPKERKQRKHRRRASGTSSLFYCEDRQRWVAQIILEHGNTRQRYFKTQEEAANALNEMLYEQKRGILVTEKDQTVRQHFEHWLEIHQSKIRWTTYLGYSRMLKKHILPTIGRLSLQEALGAGSRYTLCEEARRGAFSSDDWRYAWCDSSGTQASRALAADGS